MVHLWQLVLGAYLLGSLPVGYFSTKWSKGVDLRYRGSGNVGAANMLRFTSRRMTLLVALFDCFKGGILVWLAYRLGLGLGSQMVVGLAAVCGHNWPIFLRFRGGRGVLTTSSVVFTTVGVNDPPSLATTAVIVSTFSTVILTSVFLKRGPLGVFIAMVTLPLLVWALRVPLPLVQGCLGLLGAFVVRRLTARSPVQVKAPSTRHVLSNRLLFDRDIRDREAWLAMLQS